MIIKNQKYFNFTMIILSWLTIPLIGMKSLKRFSTSSIIILVIEFISVIFGKKREWWVFYNKPNSYLINEVPFIVGPFSVLSLWVLKLSYGNFKNFIILNLITSGFFSFVFTDYCKNRKIFTLVRLNKFQSFAYFFHKSFLLYGFQKLNENKWNINRS